LLALLFVGVSCASQVKVEPTRGVVEHPRFVRVVVRDAVPGEIKLLILNLQDQPLKVVYDKIELEAHFGSFQRAKPTGYVYTVPPRGSKLITLRFGGKGLRKGDALTISFDGAILLKDRAARLNRIEFMVRNNS
jgi:hypothetical protein